MTLAKVTCAVLACLALSSGARAEVRTKEIDYQAGGTPLRGFLAYDDATQAKRPGVIVVHEWWGLNQYARDQAIRLARAGYVALAADMYGQGKVAQHPQDAEAFVAEATKDPATVAARFDAARAVLVAQPRVDASRVAAIGYCFGGGVALGMARAGKDLAAVATFHAAVPQPAPVRKGEVKGPVLIQTGGEDPMVPVQKVEAFADELRQAGAKVEVVVYPEAKHGFTVPDAGKAGMAGLQYDPEAARKSWSRMLDFFRGALKG